MGAAPGGTVQLQARSRATQSAFGAQPDRPAPQATGRTRGRPGRQGLPRGPQGRCPPGMAAGEGGGTERPPRTGLGGEGGVGGVEGSRARDLTHAAAAGVLPAAAFCRAPSAANPGPQRKPRPRRMGRPRGGSRAAIGRPAGRGPPRRGERRRARGAAVRGREGTRGPPSARPRGGHKLACSVVELCNRRDCAAYKMKCAFWFQSMR